MMIQRSLLSHGRTIAQRSISSVSSKARLNNLHSRRNLSVTDAQTDLQNSSVTNSKSVFDPRFFFEQSLSEEAVEKLRRALLYRSRQTGWLETDVIMGKWAEENLQRLSIDELRQYSDIVKEEIMDIFKWITGQLPVPERVDSDVMRRLQAFAQHRNA